ncbi:hypothetical protein [Hymenobacter negativus]|uniref:HEAT repeat domain-containing protein n=1 Tax=Hymenobacter negativus TaxID=2795026 RepID=A0ABS3Q9A7_9BACT|nr:hypothetical protein [Hymenobacter negativus]MBO2007732.1 hypothetical protein [Hymenobacter negativus]
MDLRTELLREHSARQTEMLTDYVCLRHAHFAELLDLFFHGTPREKQLAADVLAMASTQRAAWLLPHLESLLAAAQPTAGHHPAVRRAVAKALQFIAVPEEWQVLAFDTCLGLLAAPAEPVAIRAYALSAATRLALPYPELSAELLAVAEKALATSKSAAMRSRAAREMPKLRTAVREVLPG